MKDSVGSSIREVRWTAFAPLPGFSLPSWAEPGLVLPGGIEIRALPEFSDSAKIYESLDLYAQQDLGMDTQYCIYYEYDAIAPAAASPLCGGRHAPISWIAVVDRLFLLADLSLYLADSKSIRFNYILHFTERENRDPECYPITTPSIFRRRMVVEEPLLILEESRTIQAISIGNVLWTMQDLPSLPLIGLAANLTVRSLTSHYPIDYLLAWVALEAIFGPSSPSETTYRISHRIGRFLGGSPSDAQNLANRAKSAYEIRSKIVHGFKSISNKSKGDPVGDTNYFLRESLKRILLSDALMKRFNSESRDNYLNDIVFGTAEI